MCVDGKAMRGRVWRLTVIESRDRWKLECWPVESMWISYEHIGRGANVEKPQPSVPRQAIHGKEYFAPTELGKRTEEIVHRTRAHGPQRVNDELFCSRIAVPYFA